MPSDTVYEEFTIEALRRLAEAERSVAPYKFGKMSGMLKKWSPEQVADFIVRQSRINRLTDGLKKLAESDQLHFSVEQTVIDFRVKQPFTDIQVEAAHGLLSLALAKLKRPSVTRRRNGSND